MFEFEFIRQIYLFTLIVMLERTHTHKVCTTRFLSNNPKT